MPKYSIGVVTYVNRFEQYFVPLVKQLERIFPDAEKNYVLNGFYDQEKQQKYLAGAKNFLKGTSAHSLTAYNEHQGLTKCWNQLVIKSGQDKILVLNDDVKISKLFRLFLDLQVNWYDTATINGSWSHFIITKDIIRKVGWFDERFVGVGHEDADYGLRLAHYFKKYEWPKNRLHNIYALGLKNLIVKNDDPGWKMISGNVSGKYAQVNYDVFHEKWEVSKAPKPGYVHGFNFGYYHIKNGMETPQFYPFKVLDQNQKLG